MASAAFLFCWPQIRNMNFSRLYNFDSNVVYDAENNTVIENNLCSQLQFRTANRAVFFTQTQELFRSSLNCVPAALGEPRQRRELPACPVESPAGELYGVCPWSCIFSDEKTRLSGRESLYLLYQPHGGSPISEVRFDERRLTVGGKA